MDEDKGCYVIVQPYLKRKACRWAQHLWWLWVRVPRLFFSAQKNSRVSDGEISPNITFNQCQIRICLTCPLENGAPSTATLCPLLCWKVFGSLFRRRRNRGPLKAILSPKNTEPILKSFSQRKWWKVGTMLAGWCRMWRQWRRRMGLKGRPRLLLFIKRDQRRRRPRPNLFSQHNVRPGSAGMVFKNSFFRRCKRPAPCWLTHLRIGQLENEKWVGWMLWAWPAVHAGRAPLLCVSYATGKFQWTVRHRSWTLQELV